MRIKVKLIIQWYTWWKFKKFICIVVSCCWITSTKWIVLRLVKVYIIIYRMDHDVSRLNICFPIYSYFMAYNVLDACWHQTKTISRQIFFNSVHIRTYFQFDVQRKYKDGMRGIEICVTRRKLNWNNNDANDTHTHTQAQSEED